jgi:hypothetical protein
MQEDRKLVLMCTLSLIVLSIIVFRDESFNAAGQ